MSAVRAARIGVVTAGGDAPGLNAAIRAIGRRAMDEGDDVVGILNGWSGLLEPGGHRLLRPRDLAGLLPRGGTILGSSRTPPLTGEASLRRLLDEIERLRLDALIAIGGDGTLSLARRLGDAGVRVVGVPKTIDFDVVGTEVCIGFDSAVAVVVEALDRLHTTAASHHNVMVLETMGRDTGWLAAMGGLAGGADVMCLPEFPVAIDEVAARLLARRHAGKLSSLVVVAEGSSIPGIVDAPVVLDAAGHPVMARRAIGEKVATAIASMTGFETRATVLGHVQRGGSPVATDRLWATRLGAEAHRLAQTGAATAVAVRRGDVCTASLAELTETRRRVPRSLYELCCQVG